MTKHAPEFNESVFTTDFFEYDVSKYRTKTAVPFENEHAYIFDEYELNLPTKHIKDLDKIYRNLCIIDRDLAFQFVDQASRALDELIDDIDEKICDLAIDFESKYAFDEKFIKAQLLTLHPPRKIRIKSAT
jgi:hypothetical protein